MKKLKIGKEQEMSTERLQRDRNNFLEWTSKWKKPLNEMKSTHTYFYEQRAYNIIADNALIEQPYK